MEMFIFKTKILITEVKLDSFTTGMINIKYKIKKFSKDFDFYRAVIFSIFKRSFFQIQNSNFNGQKFFQKISHQILINI